MASTEVHWGVDELDTARPLASGYAPDVKGAFTQMMHYVMQYAQDGPVRFWMRQNRKTLINGRFTGLNWVIDTQHSTRGESA